MFGFEKLEVWQLAIQFSDRTYQVTATFPSDERFGLTNQFRRSSVSISANIAEGSGRGSAKEFIRFLEIAYGSLMESISHLRIAKNRKFLSENDHEHLYHLAEQLAKMLSGLKASLQPSTLNH